MKRQKGRVTEQRTPNVQMSRTVDVVKACETPLYTIPLQLQDARFVLARILLSRIFRDLIMHNYRSNQSALMTRFGTDLRHQYGIFGDELQTSFTRNATRAGSKEGRLFSQASIVVEHYGKALQESNWPIRACVISAQTQAK